MCSVTRLPLLSYHFWGEAARRTVGFGRGNQARCNGSTRGRHLSLSPRRSCALLRWKGAKGGGRRIQRERESERASRAPAASFSSLCNRALSQSTNIAGREPKVVALARLPRPGFAAPASGPDDRGMCASYI